MKMLLTGDPHMGKSSLINKIIAHFKIRQGFVTNEVISNDTRTGFELVGANGMYSTLASIDSKSSKRVSRYGVDVDALNAFIDQLEPAEPNSLLYIDEIGQMELFSARFKELVLDYLSMPNPFIGTLSSVYTDDFTDELRVRKDIEVMHITPGNRELLLKEIVEKLRN